MKTKHVEADNDGWRSCDGEVGHLVHRLQRRRQLGRVRRGALLASLALLLVSGNFLSQNVATRIESRVPGAPCAHFMDDLRGYYCDKSRADLDPELWTHIASCPDCRRDMWLYDSIYRIHGVHAKAHDGHTHLPSQTGQAVSFDELLKSATLAAGH